MDYSRLEKTWETGNQRAICHIIMSMENRFDGRIYHFLIRSINEGKHQVSSTLLPRLPKPDDSESRFDKESMKRVFSGLARAELWDQLKSLYGSTGMSFPKCLTIAVNEAAKRGNSEMTFWMLEKAEGEGTDAYLETLRNACSGAVSCKDEELGMHLLPKLIEMDENDEAFPLRAMSALMLSIVNKHEKIIRLMNPFCDRKDVIDFMESTPGYEDEKLHKAISFFDEAVLKGKTSPVDATPSKRHGL